MKPAERDELLIRVDERVQHMYEEMGDIKERTKEQNGRISKLEKWQYGCMAVVSVVGFIVVLAQNDVRELLSKLA